MTQRQEEYFVQEVFDHQVTLQELLIQMLLEKYDEVDTVDVSPMWP